MYYSALAHPLTSDVAFIRLGMDMVNKRVLIMFLNLEDAFKLKLWK